MNKINTMNYYSNTYLGARTKFKKYSKQPGIYTDKIILENIEGSEEEPLYIDLAYYGSLDPSHLLIHSSGVNGISGFAGSAIQCALLDKNLPNDLPSECTILFIHGVNPYGMSHYRKWNENNVNLNNNFNIIKQEDSKPFYSILNDVLNPKEEPIFWGWDYYKNKLETKLLYGISDKEIYNDVFDGQNVDKKGIYFNGKTFEQGPDKLLEWIKDKFPNVIKITHIDVNTDYGRFGKVSLDPYVCTSDPTSLKQYEKSINMDILVNSSGINNNMLYCENFNEESLSKGIKNLYSYMDDTINDSDFYGVRQTFGTYNEDYILQSLITENYFHNNTNDVDIDHFSKQDIYKTYCPKNKFWRKKVIEQGLNLFENVYLFAFN